MNGRNSRWVGFARIFLVATLSLAGTLTGGSQAQELIPPDGVFDEFNPGALASWRFAGAHPGGVERRLDNLDSIQGISHLHTVWHGPANAEGNYGGFTRSLTSDEGEEEDLPPFELPDDPWFNIWGRNVEGVTGVESYVLTIYLREDLDGDEELSSEEDLFRWRQPVDLAVLPLDVWVLLSVPVEQFDVFVESGDGEFDGVLGELTIQLEDVVGEGPIEVDFDFIVFTSGGPLL